LLGHDLNDDFWHFYPSVCWVSSFGMDVGCRQRCSEWL
jgi:hypothetical protein